MIKGDVIRRATSIEQSWPAPELSGPPGLFSGFSITFNTWFFPASLLVVFIITLHCGRIAWPLVLLNHVRQLVGEQTLAFHSFRGIFPSSEDDIPSCRKGPCIQRSRQPCSLITSMDSDLAEIVPKIRFEESTQRLGKALAPLAKGTNLFVSGRHGSIQSGNTVTLHRQRASNFNGIGRHPHDVVSHAVRLLLKPVIGLTNLKLGLNRRHHRQWHIKRLKSSALECKLRTNTLPKSRFTLSRNYWCGRSCMLLLRQRCEDHRAVPCIRL